MVAGADVGERLGEGVGAGVGVGGGEGVGDGVAGEGWAVGLARGGEACPPPQAAATAIASTQIVASSQRIQNNVTPAGGQPRLSAA